MRVRKFVSAVTPVIETLEGRALMSTTAILDGVTITRPFAVPQEPVVNAATEQAHLVAQSEGQIHLDGGTAVVTTTFTYGRMIGEVLSQQITIVRESTFTDVFDGVMTTFNYKHKVDRTTNVRQSTAAVRAELSGDESVWMTIAHNVTRSVRVTSGGNMSIKFGPSPTSFHSETVITVNPVNQLQPVTINKETMPEKFSEKLIESK